MKKLLRYLIVFGLLTGTPVFAATLNGSIEFKDFSFDGLEIPVESLGFQGNIAQPFTITAPSTSTAATTTNLFGNFLPQSDLAYDIGNGVDKRWRGGYFSFVSSTSSTIPNVYLGDGSESAPALSFISQNNLGLYRLATGTIAFTTNGELIQSWMTTSTAVWNGGLSDYLNISFSGEDTVLDTIAGDIILTPGGLDVNIRDSNTLTFGTGYDAQLTWEDADANANELLLMFGAGGATNVPVFALTDSSAQNLDLGFFNGLTQPTLALVDKNNGRYLRLYDNSIDAVIDTSAGKIHLQVASSTVVSVSSTGLGIINGTEANPSLVFINDTDKGLFLDTTSSTINVVADGNIGLVVSSSGASVIDGKYFALGTGADARWLYEISDSDENFVLLALPEGDGTSVSVVGIGDASSIGISGLNFYQGETSPLLAIFDEATNDYLDFSFREGSNAFIRTRLGDVIFKPGGNDVVLGNDIFLGFGTTTLARVGYETADANANELIVALPNGGGTNVPVLVIGDQSVLNKDLGFFNGVTQPTLVLVDQAEGTYLRLYNNSTDSILDSSAGAWRFQIASSTKQLISTTSTIIYGLTDSDYLLLSSNGNDTVYNIPSGNQFFQVASTTKMRLGSTGVGYPSVATTTLSTAHSVTTTGRIMRLQGDGGATTVASTPSVQAGFDGQMITFVGTDDVNTVTFQDNLNLAASGLRLSGNVNFTLGINDTLTLYYDTVAQTWNEIHRSDN